MTLNVASVVIKSEAKKTKFTSGDPLVVYLPCTQAIVMFRYCYVYCSILTRFHVMYNHGLLIAINSLLIAIEDQKSP